jgi:cytoskeletal protein CcmA (bactofilin family)
MTQFPSVRSERGVTLVLTLLLLTVFLTLAAYGLQFSSLDWKIANNHTTGTQALNVAEAGLLHAMATMNRIGVTNFKDDIADRWQILFSPNPKSIPNLPQLTYQVQVAAGADPANTGTVTVTASGSSRSKRIVVARLRRSPLFDGRGALYLADDDADTTFSGAAFEIDGNDHDLAGALVPGGTVKPGIATRNDAVTSAVKSELNDIQVPCVRGLGYSTDPLSPSVVTGGGPGVADLNQIISDVLAQPGVQNVADSTINDGTTLGDCSHPQITHLTATSVKINGNVTACGIIIAEGSIEINGSSEFTGWIIVRGDTVVNATVTDDTEVLGNAMILGALWTGDLSVKIGGSAVIDYSSGGLQIADQIAGGGNPVPRPMVLTSWTEVY